MDEASDRQRAAVFHWEASARLLEGSLSRYLGTIVYSNAIIGLYFTIDSENRLDA